MTKQMLEHAGRCAIEDALAEGTTLETWRELVDHVAVVTVLIDAHMQTYKSSVELCPRLDALAVAKTCEVPRVRKDLIRKLASRPAVFERVFCVRVADDDGNHLFFTASTFPASQVGEA